MLCYACTLLSMQLVLLVGTKLQHVIATLALENAGITGFSPGAKLKPRDALFWFKKPELLLFLIHFILFQVHIYHCDLTFLFIHYFLGTSNVRVVALICIFLSTTLFAERI